MLFYVNIIQEIAIFNFYANVLMVFKIVWQFMLYFI